VTTFPFSNPHSCFLLYLDAEGWTHSRLQRNVQASYYGLLFQKGVCARWSFTVFASLQMGIISWTIGTRNRCAHLVWILLSPNTRVDSICMNSTATSTSKTIWDHVGKVSVNATSTLRYDWVRSGSMVGPMAPNAKQDESSTLKYPLFEDMYKTSQLWRAKKYKNWLLLIISKPLEGAPRSHNRCILNIVWMHHNLVANYWRTSKNFEDCHVSLTRSSPAVFNKENRTILW
jgi:hypothetical protein